MSKTNSIYLHLLDGQPAVYDERSERIFYAGKVVRNFAESYEQLVEERKKARRHDVEDGIGPYKYEHIRIPRASLRRGNEQ